MSTGETLWILERVIVAPTMGVFYRLDSDGGMQDGHALEPGDLIGVVRSLGASTPVHSPFQGSLVGILASDGERVRQGQPIAWLRQP